MFRVLIVTGHSRIDGGAYNKDLKVSEFDFNSRVCKSLVGYYLGYPDDRIEIGFLGRINNSITATVGYVNSNFGDYDLVMELHLNSSEDKNIYGAEILMSEIYSEKVGWAEDLLNKIVSGIGTKKRRVIVKKRTETYNGKYQLEKIQVPSLIVESEFISCTKQMENLRPDDLAKVIYNFIRSLGGIKEI